MRLRFRFLLLPNTTSCHAPSVFVPNWYFNASKVTPFISVVCFDAVDKDAFQAGYADPEQQAQPIRYQARRRAQVPQTGVRQVAHRALPYRPLCLRCLRLSHFSDHPEYQNVLNIARPEAPDHFTTSKLRAH